MNIKSLNLVVDINADGRYSFWEIWELIRDLYRLPGNLLVEGLGHIPYVSNALGIHASEAMGYGSLNGLLAVTLSLLFWIALILGLMAWASPDADTDAEDNVGKATARAPGLGGKQNHQPPVLH
ncbi:MULTISPECIES: hypothetical protein [unclassified Pusillimonas]|uniref:hypothetical protein n=1 Tax=unclassified Pusillimonas TaxID=2640016 RepID=UPI000B9CA1D4|nr:MULTISPECIES: hypothetical protein [unclassified Pusillimonas]OXR50510.1 hypothetical protein PuT2_01165 [Pusillimonas sp. T2]ROT45571.1 hypothetical protein CHR62_07440 [Pusillimonas sp. NJUB218]